MKWKPPFSSVPKKTKVLLASDFGDAKDSRFIDYLENGHTFNGMYYANFLRRSRKIIRTKSLGKLIKVVAFPRHIAPAHESLVSMPTVHDCGFELVDHSPYSLDFAISIICCPTSLNTWLRASIAMTASYLLLMTFFDQQDERFFTDGTQAVQH
eukprot:XP_014770532.1 PREDICTED: uncharacterized protein LOC106869335 [Octopus bimaculoides]